MLDTHIAVWAAIDPGKLTRPEIKILSDDKLALVLSVVSIWELRLKWNTMSINGRRKGPADPAALLPVVGDLGWELLPLNTKHAAAMLVNPLPHKDPFDEMLLVQAQEEDMRLLTRDAKLLLHPLAFAKTNRDRKS